MNENERLLLESLSKEFGSVDQASVRSGLSKSALMSAAAALEAEGLLEVKKKERRLVFLTPEGKSYLEKGTPEHRLCAAIGAGKEMALDKAVGKAGLTPKEVPVALQWAKQNGWLALRKEGGVTIVSCSSFKESEAEAGLKKIGAGQVDAGVVEKHVLETLEKRRLVGERSEKEIFLKATAKGLKALKEEGAVISRLTPEMLRTGSWRGKEFKKYDLRTIIAPVLPGKKHVYKQFIARIRERLIGLGFREVHGPLIETEFWNMDVLFMAQDHPAREIHDIFFTKDPSKGELPKELVERVKWAHEVGGRGSKGWRYAWNPEVAARLILRSHDTGITARELAKNPKSPDRVFFITRVFRPDKIDWKHSIEFHQLGGYVADESMNFCELLGYLKTFAVEICGAEEARFAPSYFPFTEPSVELLAKVPGKGWTEMGGAGMFRPEMLDALGIEVPVLAWGIGLDRFAMMALDIRDIRDLYSHDIQFLRNR